MHRPWGDVCLADYEVEVPEKADIDTILKSLFGYDEALEFWRKDLKDALGRPIELSPFLDVAEYAIYPVGGLNGRTPPLLSRNLSPTNVPLPKPSFIGRQSDIARVLNLFSAAPASASIIIQGVLGIGKTEFSKAIAHDPAIIARFGARRWFVSLENITTAIEMRRATSDAIGGNPELNFAGLLDCLRGHQALVILDHIRSDTGQLANLRVTMGHVIADLLSLPEVSVIASVRGFGSIESGDWSEYALPGLNEPQSLALFAKFSGKWVFEDPQAAPVLDGLEGNPLAIKLLAKATYGIEDFKKIFFLLMQKGIGLLQDPNLEPDQSNSFKISLDAYFKQSPLSDRESRFVSILSRMPGGLSEIDRLCLFGLDITQIEGRLQKMGLISRRGDKVYLPPTIRLYIYEHVIIEPDSSDLVTEYMKDLIREVCLGFDENLSYNEFIESIEYIDNIDSRFGNMDRVIKVNNRDMGAHDIENIRLHVLENVINMASYAKHMMRAIHEM